MTDLYKLKRELLKNKRELRKKAMGRTEAESSAQRVYGEATKTKKALKTFLFQDKSKKSATQGLETSIEKTVREFLEQNNIAYQEQKNLRWLNYDFYIPEINLFIEVQGEYHHCDPRLYPKGPKNDLQRRGVKQTQTKRDVAEKEKVNLLELWQPDIEKSWDVVSKKTLDVVSLLKNEKESQYRFYSSIDWTK